MNQHLPLIRTRENWTWGIVNIPLIYGHDNRNGITPINLVMAEYLKRLNYSIMYSVLADMNLKNICEYNTCVLRMKPEIAIVSTK